MEGLSGKCIRNSEDFFKLLGYWEEKQHREKEVSEILQLLEDEPSILEEEDEIVELTPEEVLLDDCRLTMEQMLRKIENENF